MGRGLLLGHFCHSAEIRKGNKGWASLTPRKGHKALEKDPVNSEPRKGKRGAWGCIARVLHHPREWGIRSWVSSSAASHKWKQICLIHRRSHSSVRSCASSCRLGQLHYHVAPRSPSCCKEMPTDLWVEGSVPEPPNPALYEWVSGPEGLEASNGNHLLSSSYSSHLVNPFPFLFFSEWRDWAQMGVTTGNSLQGSWGSPCPGTTISDCLIPLTLSPSLRSIYPEARFYPVQILALPPAIYLTVLMSEPLFSSFANWEHVLRMCLSVLRQQMSLPRRWILP